MRKTMTRKTMILSIGIVTIFILLSLTSVVSYQVVRSSQTSTMSPLFHRRLENIVQIEDISDFVPMYIGKDRPIQIPLPTREILTTDILTELSRDAIIEQVRLLRPNLIDTWEAVLGFAKNNLGAVNRFIRQDYNEYYAYLSNFSSLSKQEVQHQFIVMLEELEFQGLPQNNPAPSQGTSSVNITTGLLCNITSGSFCQITSQPICQITTQPICSLTKGFFCWTIYGPICPTTGLKCHPPTSRPVLCSIFGAAGKILKTIILVLLVASVIFVPIAILSLVFITVSNPDRCEQIHEQITLRFNCTTPE